MNIASYIGNERSEEAIELYLSMALDDFTFFIVFKAFLFWVLYMKVEEELMRVIYFYILLVKNKYKKSYSFLWYYI